MPRNFELPLTPFGVTDYDITINKDEPARIVINSGGANLQLKIAETLSGRPIVTMPSANGAIVLIPRVLERLAEGRPYHHTIWDHTNPIDPIVVARGTFRCQATVAGGAVQYPTVTSVDNKTIVFATQAQIDAIDPKDADTDYVATDGALADPVVIRVVSVPVVSALTAGDRPADRTTPGVYDASRGEIVVETTWTDRIGAVLASSQRLSAGDLVTAVDTVISSADGSTLIQRSAPVTVAAAVAPTGVISLVDAPRIRSLAVGGALSTVAIDGGRYETSAGSIGTVTLSFEVNGFIEADVSTILKAGDSVRLRAAVEQSDGPAATFFSDAVTVQPVTSNGPDFTLNFSPDAFYARETKTGGETSKGYRELSVGVVTTDRAPLTYWFETAGGEKVGSDKTAPEIDGMGTFAVRAPAHDDEIRLAVSSGGETIRRSDLFSVGRLIVVAGQSLAVRLFESLNDRTDFTTLGYPVAGHVWNGTGYVRPDPANEIIDSAFIPSFCAAQTAHYGVACAVRGSVQGATRIGLHLGGSLKLQRDAALADGAEGLIWLQGHSDSVQGATKSQYKAALTTLVDQVNAAATIPATDLDVILCTVPNIGRQAWGTLDEILEIRAAAYEFSSEYAAGNTVVFTNPMDIELHTDDVHQVQAGSIAFARHFHRAFKVASNDYAGAPTITSATYENGTTTLVSDTDLTGDVGNSILLYSGLTGDATIDVAATSVVGRTIQLEASVTGDFRVVLNPTKVTNRFPSPPRTAYADEFDVGDHLYAPPVLALVGEGVTVADKFETNMTARGTIGYAEGRFGNGLSNGRPFVDHAALVASATSQHTIETWFKQDALQSGPKILFGNDGIFWVALRNNGATVAEGSAGMVSGSVSGIEANVWHHLSVEFDNGIATVYVDGTETLSTSYTAPAGELCMRDFRTGGSGFAFNGTIDEFAVFAGIKNGSNFTPPTAPYNSETESIVALWSFEDDLDCTV